MKTKAFIFLSLLSICSLLPAQNVKLDIAPHFMAVRADSFLVSMDIVIDVADMDGKNSIILTPILTAGNKRALLPYIQLNGKQKQKLYLRNQILRKKNISQEGASAYVTTGIKEEYSGKVSYRTSLPAEEWMNGATLSLRRCIVRPEGEQFLKDTIIIAPQPSSFVMGIPNQSQSTASTNEFSTQTNIPKKGYKGAYTSPETDETDIRNQKELNFSLEEAKMMADINPQMLSLRELYTVAISYTDNREKFYQLINTSVKLYPVHPIANLNAAAAAIEQGNASVAGKLLSMAPRESLAYKNCRGVYELMIGNTYEGIRMLKAAKAEGSEEAAYNLNVFFENNKSK